MASAAAVGLDDREPSSLSGRRLAYLMTAATAPMVTAKGLRRRKRRKALAAASPTRLNPTQPKDAQLLAAIAAMLIAQINTHRRSQHES